MIQIQSILSTENCRGKQSMALSHLWRWLAFKGCRAVCTAPIRVQFSFCCNPFFWSRCAQLRGTARQYRLRTAVQGCRNQCISDLPFPGQFLVPLYCVCQTCFKCDNMHAMTMLFLYNQITASAPLRSIQNVIRKS